MIRSGGSLFMVLALSNNRFIQQLFAEEVGPAKIMVSECCKTTCCGGGGGGSGGGDGGGAVDTHHRSVDTVYSDVYICNVST
jgi:hypothetical protein